ncbi:MAG: type IX secretion system sortase PorU [Muribaculaceae bacterium]|nr:type IX secretion system sortase PorU [Muribaculaceae bacterium]
MKQYKPTYKTRQSVKIAIALAFSIMTAIGMRAADPGKYASSSVLSSGKWVKIDISDSGLHTLTKQNLKNFGFNDPNSVYIYGYGGRMISETLSTDLPDDLPPVPIVRVSDGSITFYATGHIGPKASTSGQMKYDHTINPYGDTSYYFISDVKPSTETEVVDLSDSEGLPIADTFTCQLVHERDLLQCANSGRDYLGEDFRSTKSQTFNFDLPDNTTGDAKIRVRFGANTTGAPSSFIVSANGQRLNATNYDQIANVTSSEQFYKIATTVKDAKGVGNSLNVGIEYSQGGVVNTARLDWIEVEYERALSLKDSRLYFTVNPSSATAYTISGVSEQTMIWDVTKPWDVREVKGHYDSSAKTLTIGVKEKGLREFMAFEPSAKGASIPGRFAVANQDIHGMPTPDMVIITPDEFAAASERIANLHRTHDEMTVYVLSPEKIFNEFSSGNPDVSAFRKLLKMWYDRSQNDPSGRKFGYCLLMGRPTYDQKGKNPETLRDKYPRTLIWQSANGLTETTSYCTDDFIAMLEDETSPRAMQLRKQLIGVGRYPVKSAYEADIVASKLESYVDNPKYGAWRNNVMLIADDGDSAQHLLQAQKAIKNMISNSVGTHYAYDRVYLDAFERKQTGTGLTFPDAKERMLMKWQKEGVSIISYIGHANPKEWGHEKLLTWHDINNMSNQYLPVLYAATCSYGKWDAEEISGAEIMLSNPAGGAIAIITPSRTVYISMNEAITNSVSREMLRKDSEGKGQRIGDVLRLGKNNSATPDENMLRYHLFGDPALRMAVPYHTVAIDYIDNKPLATDLADAPVIMARQTVKISGRITDNEGNIANFNGPIQYTLYDAEKSVETHGWGDKGKVEVYQDRSSKIATGSTMVKDGEWELTVLMPSEIANNYSPAFITMYAYDPDMKSEANGSTDMLYVYGYDTASTDDFEGPSIESFAVTSNGNTGATVHSNPVAMAVFSDESGINISDAAIGHKMTLMLDSKSVFDDVCNYFSPDPLDETKGSIAYPLSNLEPGDHQLTLTVWDNAGNSSSEAIKFKVDLNMRPAVAEIKTFYSRERDQLDMTITTDRALCTLQCRLECFDLSGNLLWSTDRKAYSNSNSSLSYSWDLNDINGSRLPRGIYSLRTTVTSEDGMSTSLSKKIAIPAK